MLVAVACNTQGEIPLLPKMHGATAHTMTNSEPFFHGILIIFFTENLCQQHMCIFTGEFQQRSQQGSQSATERGQTESDSRV